MLPWYATREAIKQALDIQETAPADPRVDRAADAASRAVELDLRRRFYPVDATYAFATPRSGVLFPVYESSADLVAADSITVDGTAVAAADRDLLPVSGPPFNRIRFANTIGFGAGRRPVEIAGTWGYDNTTKPGGELAAAVADATGATVDVTDSSIAGAGSLLTIGTERMVVAERGMLATGQTLQDTLSSTPADRTLTVADGTQLHVGEVLLVDAEQLLVTEVAGNDVLVRRSWNGSVLASHSSGAAVFAPRRLTVERGALGTTAATHAAAAPVVLQVYPGPVVAYAVALALQELLGETSGYGRDVAVSGAETQVGGRGLDQIRDDARRGYRRLLLA